MAKKRQPKVSKPVSSKTLEEVRQGDCVGYMVMNFCTQGNQGPSTDQVFDTPGEAADYATEDQCGDVVVQLVAVRRKPSGESWPEFPKVAGK